MSNQNNFFCLGKSTFDNDDTITMDDIRNRATKRKEIQIIERRKKYLKDIYARMMQNSFNKNIESNNTNNNDMEVEDENNNMNEINNKKNLINKCLNEAKDLYDKLGEEFIYQIIDDKKISFCPKCTYPVIIIDKKNLPEKNINNDTVTISCVNSCFQFELSELVFNKYSMDNIMDLYTQALKNDNKCNHNDIAPITSGDDGVLFTCVTCIFDQFN